MVRVIDRNLDRGQDVRDPLDLVNDDRWTVAGQKAVGIVTGEPARLGVLQVDVIEVGKVVRARVVFPDWRGPVRVITG